MRQPFGVDQDAGRVREHGRYLRSSEWGGKGAGGTAEDGGRADDAGANLSRTRSTAAFGHQPCLPGPLVRTLGWKCRSPICPVGQRTGAAYGRNGGNADPGWGVRHRRVAVIHTPGLIALKVATACVGDISQPIDLVGGCLKTVAVALRDSASAPAGRPCRSTPGTASWPANAATPPTAAKPGASCPRAWKPAPTAGPTPRSTSST